ncbi:MAG: NADH-quinone oxidoreductase subunit A [Armatimonadetes bacterium]|nr:NADH-quinone oxidoreductase subunit A [Armatimonadota bacterium]
MHASYATVGVFLLLGLAFVGGTFAASWLLRPHHPHREKLATYECGERPLGNAWVQFRVVFYLFALVFVVFDVEVVFLVPWALVFRDVTKAGMGWFALGEMVVFLAILMAGWWFAYRRGCFDWE